MQTLGLFAEYQPRYASHNIPTFPMEGKLPAVKGYARFGLKASEQLTLKFAEAEAIAFMAGMRTKITSVDVDSDDEGLWRDTERRFGSTPIMVRTPSGGVHFWYLHGGEARKVRPDPNVPVDVLGGGVVVAPPSKGSKGTYQFIRGGLADLDKLRPAANIIEFPKPKLLQPVARELIGAGSRSDALFRHLMRIARYCDDLDGLLDVAFTFANQTFDRTGGHPFTDAEIIATARSVHHITERGENRFGGKPHTILFHDVRDKLHDLGPDALFLHSVLAKWAGSDKEFLCANGMADHMPGGKWTPKRFAQARRALIDAGIIKEVRKAYTGHAARFSWA